MAQWVYLLDLKNNPELIAEYEAWHIKVWPEVLEHLRNSGFEKCEILRAGNRLVMIVESPTPVASDGGGATIPEKVLEWEQVMDRYQQRLPFADSRVKWVLTQSIFSWESPEST